MELCVMSAPAAVHRHQTHPTPIIIRYKQQGWINLHGPLPQCGITILRSMSRSPGRSGSNNEARMCACRETDTQILIICMLGAITSVEEGSLNKAVEQLIC